MSAISLIPQSTIRNNNPKVILLVFPGMFMPRESCTCSIGFTTKHKGSYNSSIVIVQEGCGFEGRVLFAIISEKLWEPCKYYTIVLRMDIKLLLMPSTLCSSFLLPTSKPFFTLN